MLLSSPPTYPPPSIYLPTNTLGRYLPNPTYMATPTYLVGIPIDPPTIKNDEERIKWRYCMEFGLVHWSKLIKARLKYLSPSYVKVLPINIGCKHDVLMCSKGIAISFENFKVCETPQWRYCKLCFESVLHNGVYCKVDAFNACCTHVYQTIRSKLSNLIFLF